MNRIGFYHWAGPGIIDLLRVKYHNPKIDIQGHLQGYDLEYLKKAQNVLGITDIWTTFSWGFNETNEQAHREFIATKLPDIKRLGLRTYGYVQGFNLVTEDFKNQDVFCRDFQGKPLPYSKGRNFTCPNNPEATNIIKERIKKACQLNFDAIYIDNIFFGLHPLFVFKNVMPFFGCSCKYCQKKFKQKYGYDLPLGMKISQQVVADYLEFRADSISQALEQFSVIARINGKTFGVNLYDFYRHNSKIYFGYDFNKIEPFLDYYLFENHSFKNKNFLDNGYLQVLAKKSTKPIFVLSYNKGIGCEPNFGQKQLDLIYTEAVKVGYSPCVKGSEYTTMGRWHVLNLSGLHQPKILSSSKMPLNNSQLKIKKLRIKPMFFNNLRIWHYLLPRLMRFIYNNKYANKIFHSSGLYSLALKSIRNFEI